MMKRNIVLRLDENHFVGGAVEVDPTTWEVKEGSKIYITERRPTLSEVFSDVSGEPLVITVRNIKANAFKSRITRKFFAMVNQKYGKEYVKEHNEDFRKMIGDILVTVFKLLEAENATKDWIIDVEIELVKTPDEKVVLRKVTVYPTKPVKVYKLVSE